MQGRPLFGYVKNGSWEKKWAKKPPKEQLWKENDWQRGTHKCTKSVKNCKAAGTKPEKPQLWKSCVSCLMCLWRLYLQRGLERCYIPLQEWKGNRNKHKTFWGDYFVKFNSESVERILIERIQKVRRKKGWSMQWGFMLGRGVPKEFCSSASS